MAELRWRIHYDDGSAFSNLDGRFEDAPADGVLAVVERDEQCGHVIYYGKDFYVELEDGTIAMCDDLGPFLRGLGIVKFGRWAGRSIWNAEWDRIARAATDDFGPKSDTKPIEA